jgi:poly(3-hydroxybutyrate) depolymerase
MKYLLKTERNEITSYKIVDEDHEIPKGTKYFIPYRTCVYKDTECAIISRHLNYTVILFEGKEIQVSKTQITTI